MPKKILIVGATGMLGNALMAVLGKYKEFSVWGTLRDRDQAKKLPKELQKSIIYGIDVLNPQNIVRALKKSNPNVIINCVAYLKEPQSDKEKELAICVNSLLPHQLAELASKFKTRLIHISTDSVFETDFYSRTKLLGEVDSKNCLTIRTSIIGHGLENKDSLIDWFLSQKKQIKGFKKIIYSGFPTTEIARIIAEFIIPNKNLSGIYEISSKPISKYELLKIVARIYKKKIEILPDYAMVLNRSLNSKKFQQATGYYPPAWEDLVAKMHQYYQANPNFVKF